MMTPQIDTFNKGHSVTRKATLLAYCSVSRGPVAPFIVDGVDNGISDAVMRLTLLTRAEVVGTLQQTLTWKGQNP